MSRYGAHSWQAAPLLHAIFDACYFASAAAGYFRRYHAIYYGHCRLTLRHR